MRRHYPSIKAVLDDYPSTTALINCSALGSLHLEDVKDTNLYPTRGQTVLVAEPKVPIERMYLRTPKRVDPIVAYVVSLFPFRNPTSIQKAYTNNIVPPSQRRRCHPRREQTRQRLVRRARHIPRANHHAAVLRAVSGARKAGGSAGHLAQRGVAADQEGWDEDRGGEVGVWDARRA